MARDKKGLTKFLKSVSWRDSSEVKQAVEELLPMWTEIDTDDALELLGPGIIDSRVRGFAVKQLSRADDDVRRDFQGVQFLVKSRFAGTVTVLASTSAVSKIRERRH